MVTRYGTDANELLNGSADADTIFGGPAGVDTGTGNDTINGFGGNDSLYGGDGLDSLFGNEGRDSIFGGTGNDSLVSGTEGDVVYGGEGDDTIAAGAGADLILGGIGADSVDAGTEDDTLIGGEGADRLFGGAGTDIVDYSGSSAAVTVSLTANTGQGGDAAGDVTGGIEGIIGSAFADSLAGGATADVLYGGDGQDTILGNAGNDLLSGGAGDDSLSGGSGADTFLADEGGDVIAGGAETDTLDYGASTGVSVDLSGGRGLGGLAQGDTISGVEVVVGSGSDDTLSGSSVNETLSGGGGNDSLNGQAGNDVLFGGAGNDTVIGGTGTDSLGGEDGDDHLSGGANADTLTGGAGQDSLLGGEGRDVLDGGSEADVIAGGGDDDSLTGGDGNDILRGDGITASASPTALVWTAQGPSGTNLNNGFTQSTGSVDVGFSYTSRSATTTATVTTEAQYNGTTPATSGLLLTSNGTGPETASLSFTSTTEGVSDSVRDVRFRINDLDATTGMAGYVDRIQVIAYDAEGNVVPVSLTTTGSDTVIGDTATAAQGSNNADQAEGSMLVSIDGPVSRIELSYTSASGTGQRYLYLTDIAFSPRPVTEGNDTLTGGAGDDQILGDGGNDSLSGGLGDDTLSGGAGIDTLSGGDGADTLQVEGADTAQGEAGDDRFVIGSAPTGAASVAGGEGTDTLDLSNAGSYRYDSLSSDTVDGVTTYSGVVRFGNDATVAFEGIENIICFTPGTRILTPFGERPVEDLAQGDLVVTRDDGVQPIRWIGTRTVPAEGRFAPVRLMPNAVPGLDAPLLVSPQHRMLVAGPRINLYFATTEVLVPARHLVDGAGVNVVTGGTVTYIHLLFDRHQVIHANGAATESFHPGSVGLSALDDRCREELFTLFPVLRSSAGSYGHTARTVLKAHESRVLLS